MTVLNPRNESGDVLKTRFMGARFRDEIRTLLDRGEDVRIDFSGVGAISHSFADECFGDLFSELGADLFRERVRLAAANEGVRAVLRLVFADRRSKETV
ncbi:MAG: STAS-like domain-containing protein [Verrucomicrobiaceae bacterium]|nr:STAS-like domain-containing protein [Verrucomicrobiaceae bacterium]